MRFQFILISTVLSIILLSCHLVESVHGKKPVSPIIALGEQLMKNDNKYIQDGVAPKNTIHDAFRQIDELSIRLNLPTLRGITDEIIPYMKYYKYVLTPFADHIDEIETLYDTFKRYTNDAPFDDSTIRSFVNACASPDYYALPLYRLFEVINPKDVNTKNMFNIIVENGQSKASTTGLCDTTISLQQQLHRLYDYIAITMVKGHAMKLYAYHLLKQFDNQSHTAEMFIVKQNFTQKMMEIEGIASNAMNGASRDLRPCDPKTDEEGVTYMQLKWLFGSVVINQIYLNSKATCSGTCENYQDTNVYPLNWPTELQYSCHGRVYNCFTGLFDRYCPTTKAHRRYDGFKEYDRTFKDSIPARGNVSCRGNDFPLTERPNPELFHRCDDCVCSCDDLFSEETVRTFSTRRVASGIADNRVITGLRLVEKRRVIHIQIQDGKLGPYGTIDSSTLRWKDVEEFDYTDPSVPATDYFTIRKGFDKLYFRTQDSLPGFALTGIQFVQNLDGITLGIEVSPIDFEAGTMKVGWPSQSTRPRHSWKELQLKEPHIPTLAEDENIVNTSTDEYLRFRQTDWRKDAAQTAIPFIDIQPVVSNPPAPLSGAGMFYKGVPGYGGFLGMKLISYDYKTLFDSSNANPASTLARRNVRQ